MRAKFPDTCRGCGDAIAPGDDILWSPDGGPRCADCGPEAPDERRGPATAAEDAPGYVRVLARRLDDIERWQQRCDVELRALRLVVDRLCRDLGVRIVLDGPVEADEGGRIKP